MKRGLVNRIFLGTLALWCVPGAAQETGQITGDEVVVTGVRESTIDLPQLLKAWDAFRTGRPAFAPTSTLCIACRRRSER